MKILGLDPASTTGWALLDDLNLSSYGTIDATKYTEIGGKLSFISKEVKSILNFCKPDIIGIEDTLLGISGVRTLSLLARISGVIILACYNTTKELDILNVSEWKKNCGLPIKGDAQKWQIQLEITKKFGLLKGDPLDDINNKITKQFEIQGCIKDEISHRKFELDKVRKEGKKKKLDLSHEEHDIKKMIDCKKKQLKDSEKLGNKEFAKVSKDIFAATGISSDVADAIAIALAVKILRKIH